MDLLERIKSGRYRAPPVRRAYIPKADGSQRMLGIPTFEDKVAQRAVTMVLEAIYEQEFLPCSYGFRPGRSAHGACCILQNVLWAKRLYGCWTWTYESTSTQFRTLTCELSDQRVTDGVVRRMIDKWLKAGVLEDGLLRRTTRAPRKGESSRPAGQHLSAPRAGRVVSARRGSSDKRGCLLIRFGDDALMAFDNILDASRVLSVLGKRVARFGLTFHAEKTRALTFA